MNICKKDKLKEEYKKKRIEREEFIENYLKLIIFSLCIYKKGVEFIENDLKLIILVYVFIKRS